MLTTEDKREIIRRKGELEKARITLKREFVGLDTIIDEIIEQVRAWYIFPEGQVRPAIINLWGMTGVGKTSLIRRMFDILDMSDRFFKFDMGEYTSGESKIKDDFSKKVKSFEDEPVIIVFDEFQIGRTIDETGSEVDRKGLRVIWDLLDTGKFDVLHSSWYGKEVYLLYMKMLQLIHEEEIEVQDGIVVGNGKEHAKMFFSRGTTFATYDEAKEMLSSKKSNKPKALNEDGEEVEEEKKTIQWLIPESFHWAIRSFWEDRFISSHEFLDHIRDLSTEEVQQFLSDTCDRAMKPKEYDFSNSIIFVIGNLDSVYSMSRESNPDVDADAFYENSLKITQTEIKSALQRRFRIEQIARLGNNHIIYPAFSSAIFRDLIDLELRKLNVKVQKRYDFVFDFAKSIHDIIYKEGVFPTQGVRPVFTTIAALIESYVGKFVSKLIEDDLIDEVETVKWRYKDNKHYLQYLNKKGKKLLAENYPVNLKVESLRKSSEDDNQAFTAVHEAGHAIVMMRTMEILPKYIRSKTANTSEGFCSSQMPDIVSKKVLEDRIAISVAGRAAEQVIFGSDRISNGAGGDVSTATQTAMRMIKFLGMNQGEHMMVFSETENANDRVANANTDEVNTEAMTLVGRQLKIAREILQEEKLLLLKMAEYLTQNSLIEDVMAEKFYRAFGVKKDLEFKDQKNYYPYKKIMEDELRKVRAWNTEAAEITIEQVTGKNEQLVAAKK